MHDPMHVVFDILRPWPNKSRPARRSTDPNPRRHGRQFGPLNLRAAEHECAHCDNGQVTDPPPSYHEHKGYYAGQPCPDCAGRGYCRTPFWRRPYVFWHFWRFRGREWYVPSVVTVWHVDPETDGSDSSCRNRYKRAWREAKADNDPLRLWWANWRMRRYDLWHVHHWKIQVGPWQNFNRWAWSRCSTCGGRFKWGEAPVSTQWHSKGPAWRKPEQHVHHMDCRGGVGQSETAEKANA